MLLPCIVLPAVITTPREVDTAAAATAPPAAPPASPRAGYSSCCRAVMGRRSNGINNKPCTMQLALSVQCQALCGAVRPRL